MTLVTLAGPAKIGGKWHRVGDTVEVGDDAAAGLDDLGLIARHVTDLKAAPGVDLRQVDLAALPADGKLITVSEEQFERAVAARAKVLAEAVTDATIEAACAEIIAERDKAVEGLSNLNRRVEELTADLDAERAAHDETRERLAATTNAGATDAPAQTDTPPEQAAETAPKKGAAAKTKV